MSNGRAKTPEEVRWLYANCESMCNSDCLDAFELEFGWRMPACSLRTWMHKHGLHVKRSRKMNFFTQEQRDWLRDNKGDFTCWRDAFERFDREFPDSGKDVSDIGSWLNRHGMTYERKSWFSEGHPPPNKLPVGSERVWGNATYVKVLEPDPRRSSKQKRDGWRLKSHVVWEQANGIPLPKGYMVRFADKDRSNFDPGNLVAIPKSVNGALGKFGLEYSDRESLETAVEIVKLAMESKRKCEAAGVSWSKVKKEAAR